MKIFTFILVLITIQNQVNAQDFDKVYYNSNWKITSKGKASYYRISGFSSQANFYDGKVTDYYILDNKIEMVGQYDNGVKNGVFNFYYPDGSLKMEANYFNDNRFGNWKEYYKNGTIKINVVYENNTEKLIELNDSLGNSLIRNNRIKHRLYFHSTPHSANDPSSLKSEDVVEITGEIIQNYRNGKWKIKKNKDLYALIKYKQGIMVKGSIYYYDFGKYQEKIITNNLSFPLIGDPVKFYTTENIFLEPGAVIKNNYFIEGRHQNKYKLMNKIIINNYEELVKYINDNFCLLSFETKGIIKINISIKDGLIIDFTTEPKISVGSMKDLKLIFDAIKKVEFIKDNVIIIEYIVDRGKEIKTN